MKEKPKSLNYMVDLWLWEHFNQEYLTGVGGLVRIQSSASVFYNNRRQPRNG